MIGITDIGLLYSVFLGDVKEHSAATKKRLCKFVNFPLLEFHGQKLIDGG